MLYCHIGELRSIALKESRTTIPNIFNLILLSTVREIMLPFSQTTITLSLRTSCSIGGYDVFGEIPACGFTSRNCQ